MKIRHSYDYTSNNLIAKIHWIEVYFLPQDNDTVQRLSARELGQMTSSVAKACMSALSSHLMTLLALDMTRIGLRVNLAADFVSINSHFSNPSLPNCSISQILLQIYMEYIVLCVSAPVLCLCNSPVVLFFQLSWIILRIPIF